MKWKNLIKVAFKSILKNRMRSLLTMLGIIIGVGAVIAMIAIGEGVQFNIKNRISALGSNLLIVSPGESRRGGVSHGAGSLNRLTLDDTEKLNRESMLCERVSPIIFSMGQVISGGSNWLTSVNGVSADYLAVRDWPLVSGTFFTEREDRSRSKVVVLGSTVADNLFPGQDPVGSRIRFRNVPFKVIGVLSKKGQSATGSDLDDVMLVPSQTVLYRLSGWKFIQMILAKVTDVELMGAAREEIRLLLRESHKLELGEEDNFTIRNQAEITDTLSETSKMLTLLLGSIAGVSLLVGGIGIMNIMLVSVTERTREIGIRLAIGARERDVLIQFLVEAIVLSLIGGILGILAGIGFALLLNNFFEINTYINQGIILLAFLFSGAIGVFFGFYPARKAAAQNPIEALRYE